MLFVVNSPSYPSLYRRLTKTGRLRGALAPLYISSPFPPGTGIKGDVAILLDIPPSLPYPYLTEGNIAPELGEGDE
jgi:hypothetical protein